MWGLTDMQRWQGLAEAPDNFGPSVVTIGVFDGVHRGHQRIVNRAREAASELGLPVVVVTFDPHPVEVVRPGSHPPFLCTPRRMSELLTGLGVDAACVIEFTLEFSRLDPDEFVRAVLVDKLHAARVVVGEDFRFGHKAAGDVALLADLGEKYDFTAEGVPLLTEDGVRISSTEIRARLAEGDVEGAAHDLGRPHRVEGVVVRGHQRGRALGFPTANLETLPHTAIPADGVYAGWLTLLDIDGLDPAAGTRALAGRDLRWHESDLRRPGADGRGVRAGPRRPGPIRGPGGGGLHQPAAGHRAVRLGAGSGRADARGRRAGPAAAQLTPRRRARLTAGRPSRRCVTVRPNASDVAGRPAEGDAGGAHQRGSAAAGVRSFRER